MFDEGVFILLAANHATILLTALLQLLSSSSTWYKKAQSVTIGLKKRLRRFLVCDDNSVSEIVDDNRTSSIVDADKIPCHGIPRERLNFSASNFYTIRHSRYNRFLILSPSPE